MTGMKLVVPMEELRSRKVVRIEVGETSSSRDQLVFSIDEAQTQSSLVQTITREERFKMLMEDVGGNTENQAQITAATPKIQKVIFLLRDHKNFVKYYEPRVVSLGPIHYGKAKYQLAEKFKLRLAKEFVKSSGKTIQDLCKEIDGKIKELRECFEEEVTNIYDDEALAWILVVDGCAILQYIYLAVEDKLKDLNIKTDSTAFCQQDLLLLENQVPYRLLELLMSLSAMGDKLRTSIKEFIKRNHYMVLADQQSGQQQQTGEREQRNRSMVPADPQSRQQQVKGERKPTHLLDLLRTSLLDPEKQMNSLTEQEKGEREPRNHIIDGTRSAIKAPIEKKEKEIIPENQQPRQQQEREERNLKKQENSSKERKVGPEWQSYRNVQELTAAGIHVKRSETNSLRSIDFTRRLNFYPGYLWLPPLIVDDSTGPKFMNLIAYEMCLDFDNDFGVTSYISFLDSLIDEANDVKELRKAGVLYNFLGSDEEVAQLFNEIGTDLVPDPNAYKHVKIRIQDHYNNTWMTWIAEFFHNHFSSPLTILAFLGALFGLGLTAAQTWYAVDSPPGPCDDFCNKLKQNL